MTRAGRIGISLQTRDIDLLRGLFESRIATLAHLAALHFDGRQEAAKKRVQKLKAAALIVERPRQAYEPAVHRLSTRAFDLLIRLGELSNYSPRTSGWQFERRVRVGALTLRHELEVMDVKAAMVRALRDVPTLSVLGFSTWPRLSEFQAIHPANGAKTVIKPDGFLQVREKVPGDTSKIHRMFLELDRSTESHPIIVARIQCYLDFYKRGGMAKRCEHDAAEFRDYPFRVLIVCKSVGRRDNLAERLAQINPPIRTFVWLATLADVTASPLGDIWVTPATSQSGQRKRLFLDV